MVPNKCNSLSGGGMGFAPAPLVNSTRATVVSFNLISFNSWTMAPNLLPNFWYSPGCLSVVKPCQAKHICFLWCFRLWDEFVYYKPAIFKQTANNKWVNRVLSFLGIFIIIELGWNGSEINQFPLSLPVPRWFNIAMENGSFMHYVLFYKHCHVPCLCWIMRRHHMWNPHNCHRHHIYIYICITVVLST